MPSIKKELISGVFYIAIAKYSGILVQIVVAAILARLLSPEDFGIVAVVTVFITFFNILSDIGIGPAIIQNKTLTECDINHIFSFTCYVGAVLGLLFFSCSWWIADYYKNEELVLVSQLLSLTIFFHCINIVPQNIQYRYKRFKFVAFASLIVQIVTGIISCAAAFSGLRLYSLVLSAIMSAFLPLIVFLLKEKLQFHWKMDFAPLKIIMSFSLYQFAFNFINYFSRNLDKLMIGRMLGVVPLGYYEKSYRLMMMPLQNITFVITPVMLPVFSGLQDSLEEMAEKYIRMLRLLSCISLPLSILLYFSAEEIIYLFFGPQWEAAIEPFKILSLTVSLQILTSTSGSIYQAANDTRGLFISGCCCAFFMVSAFTIAIWGWGSITAVAWGFLCAQLLNTIQCFGLLFKRLRYSIWKFLQILLAPLSISILLFVILYVLNKYLFVNSYIIQLINKSFMAFSITVICVQIMGVYDVRDFVRNKIIMRK